MTGRSENRLRTARREAGEWSGGEGEGGIEIRREPQTGKPTRS